MLKIKKRLSQKGCQPEFIEGYQFDCQYFDKLNMTIKLTFETASFNHVTVQNRDMVTFPQSTCGNKESFLFPYNNSQYYIFHLGCAGYHYLNQNP